jgi:hypothetical protein
VQSISADQGALAVYAAQRSADGVLTIMVINKSNSALASAFSLSGFIPQPMAAVYRYSPANFSAIQRAADQAVTASGFSASFPASSITLLMLPLAGQTNYVLGVTKYGSGLGTITSSTAGINCGASCSASFSSGSSVTLTAQHPAGNAFTAWSGDCSGNGRCVVTMNAAKTVVATFVTGSTSPIAMLDPNAVGFAPQFVGSTSTAATVTLINNGGATLNLSSITASAEFAVTNDCGGSLAPGALCHLSVSFSPTVAGAKVGTLTVIDSAAGSPHVVALSGTGVAATPPICVLSAAPTSVARGGTSILTASCNPSASSYAWTGGTCAGSLLANCTVMPTRTTTYSVTGTNNYGASLAVSAKVSVKTVDLAPILMLLLD